MTGIETQTQKLTGAQIFLECLKKVGVDEIFGYPGGVILTIYEALYNCPEIKHYLVRMPTTTDIRLLCSPVRSAPTRLETMLFKRLIL